VYVKLEGVLTELLVEVDPPIYQHFLTKEGARPVLFVFLKKDLYGTLQAAMLFLKNLIGKLKQA